MAYKQFTGALIEVDWMPGNEALAIFPEWTFAPRAGVVHGQNLAQVQAEYLVSQRRFVCGGATHVCNACLLCGVYGANQALQDEHSWGARIGGYHLPGGGTTCCGCGVAFDEAACINLTDVGAEIQVANLCSCEGVGISIDAWVVSNEAIGEGRYA